MNSSSNDAQSHGTRRHVLGWSLAGLATSTAGYFGWKHAGGAGPVTQAQPAASAPTAASVPQATETTAAPPAAMSREAFAQQLQTTFRIDKPLAHLKLIDVSDVKMIEGKGIKFACFSLLFSAPGSLTAESTTYHLVHEKMGAMDLFLSPVGNGKKGTVMEACFTQRV